jgi:hypothetical protein
MDESEVVEGMRSCCLSCCTRESFDAEEVAVLDAESSPSPACLTVALTFNDPPLTERLIPADEPDAPEDFVFFFGVSPSFLPSSWSCDDSFDVSKTALLLRLVLALSPESSPALEMFEVFEGG